MNEKHHNEEPQPPSGLFNKIKKYFRNPFFIKTQSVSEVTDFLKDALDQNIIDKEVESIASAVVGGCLLIGGYVSAIGAAFGVLIFGTVSMGIFYTDVDTDWFKVFLGAMMLIAVVFNNYVRKRVTESK